MNKVGAFLNELEAEALLAQGKFTEALPLLRNALEKNEYLNKESLLCNISLCYFKMQDYKQSVFYLQELFKINPEYPTVVYNLAYSCLMLNDYNQAVKNFEAVREKEGMNQDIAYNLGTAYMGRKEGKKAMECFNYLIDTRPLSPQLIYNAGIGLVNNGFSKEARDFFIKYLSSAQNDIDATFGLGIAYNQQKDYRKAIECFLRVISWDEMRYPSAFVSLGMAYFQIGNISKSLEYLNEAARFNLAEAWYYLGVVYEATEQLDNAVLAYKKAGDIDHAFWEVWEKLGNLYLKKSSLPESRISYKKAFKLTGRPFFAFKAGLISMMQKEYPQALEYFLICFEKKSEDEFQEADLYQNLAVCCYYLDKHAESVNYARKALEIDKKRESVYFVLGSSLLKTARTAEARTILLEGLKFCPEDVNLLYTLGVLEGSLGDYRSSSDYFSRAVKITRSPDVLYALGLAKMKLNDKDSAAELFDEFKQYHKDDPDMLYKLGLLFIELKNYNKAKTAFKEVLSINPGEEKAKNYLYSLEEKINKTKKRGSLLNIGKNFLFLLLLLPFISCSQEHLILVKNIQRLKLLTIQDMLQESGFGKKRLKREILTNQTVQNEATDEKIEKSKVVSYNKQLNIPENQDFSINIKPLNDFIILKSVQGDVQYVKASSQQEKGLFMFHSGKRDSKIQFQQFDVSGALVKNLNYYVKIQAAVSQPSVTVSHSSAMASNTNKTGEENVQTLTVNPNISTLIITSIQGLSPTEALRELRGMLSSSEFTDDDKELIRYKMTEILIEERSFKDAQVQIDALNNKNRKSLYTGKLLMARKNNKEALRYYMDALGGDDETKKTAVIDMEKLILAMGAAEKNLLERLRAETKKFKNDKDFYVNSMIGIARIYQYLPDIYSAKDIYESILNGDYDEDLKEKTRQSYEELKKDFLEYR